MMPYWALLASLCTVFGVPASSKASNPKGSMYPYEYTLALKYPYRDYIKASVYTIWAHGPLGNRNCSILRNLDKQLDFTWGSPLH